MKALSRIRKLSSIAGLAACLTTVGASAQDLREAACLIERAAANGSLQQYSCRGGVLSSLRSGRPLLDQSGQAVSCDCGCFVERAAVNGVTQQFLCRDGALHARSGGLLRDQSGQPISCDCAGWNPAVLLPLVGLSGLAAIRGGGSSTPIIFPPISP